MKHSRHRKLVTLRHSPICHHRSPKPSTLTSMSHGILEFSTDKAGQDVTPINLDFEEKKRSTTLNSITGMLSQLKRSIPDLRLHKTHQPLIAQSTPPSTHRIRTIRRQSSIGAYQDNPTTLPSTTHQTMQTQQSSVPISSSTSYYTNSPSPPQATTDHHHHTAAPTTQTQQRHLETAHENRMEEEFAGHPNQVHQSQHQQQQPLPAQQQHVNQSLDTTNLAQCLTHSTLDSHSDILVLSRNQFEHINAKLDQLSRRVQSLEQTLATDVRLILTLLQGQQQNNGNVPGSLLIAKEGRQEIPEYENVTIDSSRQRYTFQRSVSEPKPISSKILHSQALHRFASFNKAFDYDSTKDPWVDTALKEKQEEEKIAPIAKLESLDELDLILFFQETPLSSPKKPKK
ncbi:hypothetical protein Trydic_g18339 [Trypoxylus dichotomus]